MDPAPTDPTSHDAPDAARTVRRYARGILRADGTPLDCRFIIDGESGELILGTERDALDADEIVLFLPDDTFDAQATLLVHARPASEDRWTDRHLAYHPDTRPGVMLRASVDSAKLREGAVVEGDQLALTNPLLALEPAMCRLLNSDRDTLRSLCSLMTGTAPESPVAVGVDRFGIDLRAQFGIIRLELPAPCDDPSEAERVIQALLEGAA